VRSRAQEGVYALALLHHLHDLAELADLKPGLGRQRMDVAAERQPLKRLDANEAALLKLLHRWRNEAGQAGRQIKLAW
jgi:hypothetical protein